MKDKHSFLLSPSFLFSVRPSTMTEEYRVPDGMVGLSEYTHSIAWAHAENLFTHTHYDKMTSRLVSPQSLVEGASRSTRSSRTRAARSRSLQVSN